jgi:predicted transcriptional regulator of viral defense system
MKLEQLLSTVSDLPVFTSALLMTAGVSPVDVQKQLARWAKSGKVIQLRRGLYALGEPYRKVSALPFLVANRLREPSYVSLQSALAYHGMIPEFVPVVTSVTRGRPGMVTTPLGRFLYRHVQGSLFRGFREVEVGDGQKAFVATPEKSLLDLLYLTPRSDEKTYLDELRLQNLEALDTRILMEAADNSGSRKLVRAAKYLAELVGSEEYVEL